MSSWCRELRLLKERQLKVTRARPRLNKRRLGLCTGLNNQAYCKAQGQWFSSSVPMENNQCQEGLGRSLGCRIEVRSCWSLPLQWAQEDLFSIHQKSSFSKIKNIVIVINLKSFKKCLVESNFELVCSVYFIQIASRPKLTTHFDWSVRNLKSDNSITGHCRL